MQRRECRREIRDASGEPETSADTVGHTSPQSIVSDEEHTPLGFPTRDGLGDIVQESDDAQPVAPLLAHPRADSILCELLLHSPDSL